MSLSTVGFYRTSARLAEDVESHVVRLTQEALALAPPAPCPGLNGYTTWRENVAAYVWARLQAGNKPRWRLFLEGHWPFGAAGPYWEIRRFERWCAHERSVAASTAIQLVIDRELKR